MTTERSQDLSPFPAWQVGPGQALWVTPIQGSNTVLQYGTFRDLEIDSLRPVRENGDPVLGYTVDGLIRGQVRIRDQFRHIDVRARAMHHKLITYTPVELGTKKVCGWVDGSLIPDGRIMPQALAGLYRCNGVRALRLNCFYHESDHAPWLFGRESVDWSWSMKRTVADYLWDKAIVDAMKPARPRFRTSENPWVWCHKLRRYGP